MMKMCLLALVALGLPLAALAADVKKQPVSLYAYETAAGMKAGAVFGVLPELGRDDELVGAMAGSICERVEIHQMAEDKGIMQMRQVSSLVVREGQDDMLSAHGYHLMLMKLAAPLTAGKSFPLTLVFKKSGEKVVEIPVLSHQEKVPAAMSHEHHQ